MANEKEKHWTTACKDLKDTAWSYTCLNDWPLF